jgi:hypothetical protein
MHQRTPLIFRRSSRESGCRRSAKRVIMPIRRELE